MTKTYYKYGNDETRNLDFLCDILFIDNNIIVNCECETDHKNLMSNYTNLRQNDLYLNPVLQSIDNTKDDSYSHCNARSFYNPLIVSKEDNKFTSQNKIECTEALSSDNPTVKKHGVFEESTNIQAVSHKQILSSIFKPISTTFMKGFEESEILNIFKEALQVAVNRNERISIRYLCVYALIVNRGGLQLKKIYEYLLHYFPAIGGEKNWQGRIRYSLTLYPQFEKHGQASGSAIWKFHLE
ncbi:hypothetical protein CDIK_0005 [Cucumispora dikerogammari]|nr:hypothetical protein CDIK_0005 [Cucumispora dikerogammari]